MMTTSRSIRFGEYTRVVLLLLCMVCLGLTGCASHSVSKAKLSGVKFGAGLQQVESGLGVKLSRQFRAATTNGILEMCSVYCEEANQHWSLLFANDRFVSARPLGSFTAWGAWLGFAKKTQPDFNEISWFWRDFFPPEAPGQRLSVSVNDGQRGDWWARHQAEGMMIGMSPFIPFVVVVAPVMYLSEKPMLERMKSRYEIRPGVEERKVIELLGPPASKAGDANRSVLSFQNPTTSVGIDNGRVAFIFFGFDVNR